MILPIYIYGQPVLRKVAEDITPDYPQLKELISDMWETLAESCCRTTCLNTRASVKCLSILISWSTMSRRLIPPRKAVCRFLPSMKRWCVLLAFMWNGMMKSFSIMMSGLRDIWPVSCSMSSIIWMERCSLTAFLHFANSLSRVSSVP